MPTLQAIAVIGRTAFVLIVCGIAVPSTIIGCVKKHGMLQSGQMVEITGTARLTGSEPWTEIVVTDASGTDWYIEKSGADQLHAFLQEMVTVTGVLKLSTVVLANSGKAGIRRELTSVTIQP